MQNKKTVREADRIACERKTVYGSRHEAERTQSHLFDKGVDVDPYQCSACGLWHLGHHKKRKRR